MSEKPHELVTAYAKTAFGGYRRIPSNELENGYKDPRIDHIGLEPQAYHSLVRNENVYRNKSDYYYHEYERVKNEFVQFKQNAVGVARLEAEKLVEEKLNALESQVCLLQKRLTEAEKSADAAREEKAVQEIDFVTKFSEVKNACAKAIFEANEAKNTADIEVNRIKAEMKTKLEHAEAAAHAEIERATGVASMELESINNELLETKEKLINVEKNLNSERANNATLRRISTERANQNRGISPKKEHDGYIVLDSIPWSEHNVVPGNKKPGETWKSILQTPYEATRPISEVEPLIWSDLDDGILEELGCANRVEREDKGRYSVNYQLENTIYEWRFHPNYRAGLWEVIIYTPHLLTVSIDRAPKKYKPKEKPEKKKKGAVRKAETETREQTEDFRDSTE